MRRDLCANPDSPCDELLARCGTCARLYGALSEYRARVVEHEATSLGVGLKKCYMSESEWVGSLVTSKSTFWSIDEGAWAPPNILYTKHN